MPQQRLIECTITKIPVHTALSVGLGESCWYNFAHNGRQLNGSIIEHNGCVLDIFNTVKRVVCIGTSHVITILIPMCCFILYSM